MNRRTRRCGSNGDGPVGWLVFDRPDAGNAMDARMMHELERGVARARRRPRRPGDREHRRGRRVPDRARRGAARRDPEALREQSRRTKRFELRFTAWHNDVWKPVIAAVNGVCAGGGLHFVADADIVIASANATLRRPARVGRPGERVRDDRAREEVADGGGAAHGVRRPARTHHRGARVRARHLLAGRRPARAAARRRRRRSARRSPGNSPAAARARRSARCGPRWNGCRDESSGRDRHRDRLVHRAASRAGGRVQPLVRARPLPGDGARRPGRVRGRAVRRDRARARRCARRPARCSAIPARGSVPRGRVGAARASRRSGTRGSRARWRRSRPRTGCSRGREHVHTAVYRFAWQSGPVDGDRRARSRLRRRRSSSRRTHDVPRSTRPATVGLDARAHDHLVGRPTAARARARVLRRRSARGVRESAPLPRTSGSRARSSPRSRAPTPTPRSLT